MWVFTTGGFVSAVEHRDNADMLIVRARDRQSLETLVEGIELSGNAAGNEPQEVEIFKKTPSDYPWRIEVSKATFAMVMVHEIMNYINYSNFKNSLTEIRGEKWHKAAMNVWVDMLAVSDVKGGTNYSGSWTYGGNLQSAEELTSWEEAAVDQGLTQSYSELMEDLHHGSEEELARHDALAYQDALDDQFNRENFGDTIGYHPLGSEEVAVEPEEGEKA